MNVFVCVAEIANTPNLRFTEKGMAMTTFRLVDKAVLPDGRTIKTMHDCVAWGKMGEMVAEKFNAADMVSVLGDVRYRKNEQSGAYLAQINVREIQKAGATQAAPVDDDSDLPF